MSSVWLPCNMKNLTNALVPVFNWNQLGLNLGLPNYKLEEIRRSKMNDANLCRIALLDLWLRTDVDASWEKLIGALEDMSEETTVKKIRENYCTGGSGSRAPMSQPSLHGPGAVSGSRIVADGPSPSYSGPRRPVVQETSDPQDEILRAQQIICHGDDNPDDKLTKMVENLTYWTFDINSPDSSDPYKNTLLHYSSMKGDLESVKTLVAFGANVNLCNASKQTAFDTASMMQRNDIAKFLREMGGVEGAALNNINTSKVSDPAVIVLDDGDDQMREVGLGGEHLILMLDSSSTMALVQLEVLTQLEKATGKKTTDMFEWIVASGVGGFLMMAMVYCKKSLPELKRIYFHLRDRVFCGQEPSKRGKELESYAVEVFGATKRMVDVSDPYGPKLLIGAVNKQSTILDPIFFNNFQGEYSTVHLWKVARYTCSTPLYIGECDGYIDGGAVCKNPSISALGHIRIFYKLQSIGMHGVVSIGDGLMPAIPLGQLDMSNYYSHFLPSTSNALSEEISESCNSICEAGGLSYRRFNPLLGEYITVPEEATLKQLLEAVIRTIAQCQEEKSDLQAFARQFNNS